MTQVVVAYGAQRLSLTVPAGIALGPQARAPVRAAGDPLAVVAAALDAPVAAAALGEAARGRGHVAIVVPDPTRPSAAAVYLLPILARLARAGLSPARIRVVIARGIHPAAPRSEVERIVGSDVMAALRPIQSAPELPDWNVEIVHDEELGAVRVHRAVAEAGLVLLTGPVVPHHLAGFGGGPKALVPGVAERDTVLAAHRLTLRTLVAPDGSLVPATGRLTGNPFREALLRVARAFGRCWLLNVVLDDEGHIAAAAAGEVGAAQALAVERYLGLYPGQAPVPADAVLVGAASPRADDLVQAHKALLAALPWAKPGAPIVWLAQAGNGPGHPDLLPWFEAGRLDRHLAALRQTFHPYGLTAYSIRRAAKDHPIHVVSEVSPEITRGMGLWPHASAQAALDAALSASGAASLAVLSDPL